MQFCGLPIISYTGPAWYVGKELANTRYCWSLNQLPEITYMGIKEKFNLQ